MKLMPADPRIAPTPSCSQVSADARRARTRPGPTRPDPGRLAAVLARAWIDVRTGLRPLRQIEHLLAPALKMRLAAQIEPAGCATTAAPVVRTLTTQRPHPDACEAVVLVSTTARVTAIAVRLEVHAGSWRAVDLGAPETGIPAARTTSRPEARQALDVFDDLLDRDELDRLDQAIAAERRPLRLRGNA